MSEKAGATAQFGITFTAEAEVVHADGTKDEEDVDE